MPIKRWIQSLLGGSQSEEPADEQQQSDRRPETNGKLHECPDCGEVYLSDGPRECSDCKTTTTAIERNE